MGGCFELFFGLGLSVFGVLMVGWVSWFSFGLGGVLGCAVWGWGGWAGLI